MADEIKKPYPWLAVSVMIGRIDFEVSADSSEPTEYIVSAYADGAEPCEDEPRNSVRVKREDFLAMLEVARLDAAKGNW